MSLTLERVSISTSNKKLGPIPSVSLPPVVTCAPDLPCREDCYAVRMMAAGFRGGGVPKAWTRNLRILENHRGDFFDQVQRWLKRNLPAYFRFHIGGDLVDLDYFERLLHVVAVTAPTQHLLFTKRFDLLQAYAGPIPPRLNIVLSGWPGLDIPEELRQRFPVAWMQDGTEERIPADYVKCPGACWSCQLCWALTDAGRDILFHKH